MENKKNLRKIPHIFHVDLSDAHENEEYWVHAAGKKYALVPHTHDTRKQAKLQQPLLAKVSDERLTHYTAEPVHMPFDHAMRIHVRHTTKNTKNIPGKFGISHVMVFSPPKGDYESFANKAPVVHDQPIDYVSTAKSIIFHHADLITQDKEYSGIVMEHMDQELAPSTFALIQNLALQMRKAGPPTTNTGWANYVPFDAGEKGMHHMLQPTDATINAAGPAMTAIMISTKNDLRLQDKKWTQEQGKSVTEVDNENLLKVAHIKTSLDDNWTAAIASTDSSNGLQTSISVTDKTKRQLSVTMTNTYVRWLGAYIEFIDADGKSMNVPDWQPDDGGIIAEIVSALGLNYDNMRFIGWINPINTVFAIPIYADPGILEVKVTFPKGAVSANIYGCGLGTGSNDYPKTPVIGGVFTGLANLGIPTFFLGLAVAAQTYKPLYDLMGNKKFIIAVVAIGVAYFGADFTYQGAANKKMDWHAFSSLLQILFTQGATKALIWCEAQIVEGEIEDEIPFAGWIMVAINIATTLAQLAETIIEVATSPWMITNSVSTTITSTVTINPDPRHKAFPRPPAGSNATYITKMIYQQQNRPSVTTKPVIVPPESTPATLTSSFVNTLGGQVKFEVYFYIDSWLAGKAGTSWLPNDEEHTADIILYLFQLPIPLDNKSIYKHSSILTYRNNAYQWTPSDKAPTSTLANADTSQTGNAISNWTGLALSQRNGMIGLSWKAAGMGIKSGTGSQGQLYAFQNINIPGANMDSVKFPSVGFTSPSQLVYDVFPAKFQMKDGTFVIGDDGKPVIDPTDKNLGNYYIDPLKADADQYVDGGYHLRQVVLDNTTPFNMNPNQLSFGRFPYFPDSLTMHPSGHVIGVSSKYKKLMILQLPDIGTSDDKQPLAQAFAGQALDFNGSIGRAGLLFTPIGVSCSYDGTILILEQLSSQELNIARIQAFDLNGNPVNYFIDSNKTPTPILILPNNFIYLDIAAVGDSKTTYVYLLYYSGTGQLATDYHMTIYQCGADAPAGNFLVTTDNVSAAKINVDMWHTLYTLNYEMTTDGNGHNSGPLGTDTGPAGRTVPSASEWLPPIPK